MKTAIWVSIIVMATTCLAGWERIYDTDLSDYPRAGFETVSGDFVFLRSSHNSAWTESYMNIFKTNTDGDILFSRRYGDYSQASDMICAHDGGFILAGDIYSPSTGIDGYLVKINDNCDTVWTQRFGTDDNESFDYVIPTTDGGYTMLGLKYTSPSYHIWVVKIDSTRTEVWSHLYSIGEWPYTQENGFIRIGNGYVFYAMQFPSSVDTFNQWLFKLNHSGELVDTIFENITTREVGELWVNAICNSYSGNIIATGFYFPIDGGDFTLIEIDTSGTIIHEYTYPADSVGIADFIAQDTVDNTYIATGSITTYDDTGGVAGFGVSLIKIDVSGTILWQRTYVCPAETLDAVGVHVSRNSDGGYIITAWAYSYDSEIFTTFCIRTDSLGNSPVFEFPSQKPIVSTLTAHPNPFNSAVAITIRAHGRAPLQIEIFDINGRMVYELPVGTRHVVSLRNASVIWTPNKSVGSGVYLVRATVGDRHAPEAIITKRIVYLK